MSIWGLKGLCKEFLIRKEVKVERSGGSAYGTTWLTISLAEAWGLCYASCKRMQSCGSLMDFMFEYCAVKFLFERILLTCSSAGWTGLDAYPSMGGVQAERFHFESRRDKKKPTTTDFSNLIFNSIKILITF